MHFVTFCMPPGCSPWHGKPTGLCSSAVVTFPSGDGNCFLKLFLKHRLWRRRLSVEGDVLTIKVENEEPAAAAAPPTADGETEPSDNGANGGGSNGGGEVKCVIESTWFVTRLHTVAISVLLTECYEYSPLDLELECRPAAKCSPVRLGVKLETAIL